MIIFRRRVALILLAKVIIPETETSTLRLRDRDEKTTLLTLLSDLQADCSLIRSHWKGSYGNHMAVGETRCRRGSSSSLPRRTSSRTLLSVYLDCMFALTSYYLSHL